MDRHELVIMSGCGRRSSQRQLLLIAPKQRNLSFPLYSRTGAGMLFPMKLGIIYATHVQWSPSITDTLGQPKSILIEGGVLVSGVSFRGIPLYTYNNLMYIYVMYTKHCTMSTSMFITS